jgi:hypothetical protein
VIRAFTKQNGRIIAGFLDLQTKTPIVGTESSDIQPPAKLVQQISEDRWTDLEGRSYPRTQDTVSHHITAATEEQLLLHAISQTLMKLYRAENQLHPPSQLRPKKEERNKLQSVLRSVRRDLNSLFRSLRTVLDRRKELESIPPATHLPQDSTISTLAARIESLSARIEAMERNAESDTLEQIQRELKATNVSIGQIVGRLDITKTLPLSSSDSRMQRQSRMTKFQSAIVEAKEMGLHGEEKWTHVDSRVDTSDPENIPKWRNSKFEWPGSCRAAYCHRRVPERKHWQATLNKYGSKTASAAKKP